MVSLELRDITFRYHGMKKPLFHGLSWFFTSGRLYVVYGDNGVGKTTLLKIIAGLLKPERGTVLLDGEDIYSDPRRYRRYIGLLFQNPEAMLFNPTVFDEIAFTPRQIYDEEKVRLVVERVVQRIGLDMELLGIPPQRLSYGLKKLVALASILSYDPDIILLDEPFTNLSEKYRRRVSMIIDELVVGDKLIIIATHEVDRIKQYITSDPILLRLDNGSLIPG